MLPTALLSSIGIATTMPHSSASHLATSLVTFYIQKSLYQYTREIKQVVLAFPFGEGGPLAVDEVFH